MTVWDQVIGQDRAVATLREAARVARQIVDGQGPTQAAERAMTHSWLVSGPPGSGRSTVARAFAAALQCTGPEVGCGQCPGCVTTLARTNGDVTDLVTDKLIISIDEARSLLQAAQVAPSQGRWRVMLIEDADRMVERTSNVLLKAIEEPPERTVWLLCAPSAQDLITTIRSRCRHLRLQTPPAQAVAEVLMARRGLNEEEALSLARIAQSHVGVADKLAADPQLRRSHREILRTVVDARTISSAVLAAAEIVEFAKSGRALVKESGEGDSADDAAKTDPVEAAVAAYVRKMGYESEREVPAQLRSQVKAERENAKRRFQRSDRDVADLVLLNLLGLWRDVLVTQLGAQVPIINVDMEDDVRDLATRFRPEHTRACIEAVRLARTRLRGEVTTLAALEAMMMTFIRP